MYELENRKAQIEAEEIDLKELFLVLKSKILVILLVTLLFAGGTGIATKFFITPMYSSSVQLYVTSKTSLTQLTDLTMGNQLTQDYMVIVKTRSVLETVIKKLDLDFDYKELEKKIAVSNPSDTRIMEISVSDSNPLMAKEITQELAEVTAKRISKKLDVKKPTIIEDAYLAEEPDSPSLQKNILIGALLGLVLASGIILTRHMLNDTIRSEEDIEKYLEINTLAKLPLNKGEKKRTKKVRKAGK